MTGKSKITLFNPEQTPAVYDTQGRTVAGASRVTVDELDSAGEAAVAAGVLVREEEEKPKATATKGESASADAPPLPDSQTTGKDSGASTTDKRR